MSPTRQNTVSGKRDDGGPQAISDAFVATIRGSKVVSDFHPSWEQARGLLPTSERELADVAVELCRAFTAMPCDSDGRGDAAEGRVRYALRETLEELAQRGLPFEDRQLAILAECVPAEMGWDAVHEVAVPLAALTRRLRAQPDDTAALAACRRFHARVCAASKEERETARRGKLLARIRSLLAGGGDFEQLARETFAEGDAWGAARREVITSRFGDSPGARDVIALASRPVASKIPTARWRKECAHVLAACPSASDLLRAALEPLLTAPYTPYDSPYGTFAFFLKPANTATAKVLLWMLVEARPTWAPKFLADLAIHCAPGPRDQTLANACVLILGELGDRAAVGQLARTRLKIRNLNTRKQIDMALATASAKSGVTPAELLEMCVPDFGLGADGRRTVLLDGVSAVVELTGPSGVRLAWRDSAGAELKAAPPTVRDAHKPEISALKADVKEIRTTLGTERARIEDLLAGTRRWPVATWLERYVRHPVTGYAARGLLWNVPVSGGARRTGLLRSADGTLTDTGGARFAADPGDEVRLWHPIESTPDEIEAWRRRIIAEEIVQPLKQAFREVYVLTPAEERTRVYSNRFAAHVLRYRQASALMKARMWHANALGGWDGGADAVASKDFPDQAMRAEFFHEAIREDGESAVVLHCTTDQVRFFRAGGEEPVPLADVPPLVFSEAMRDVDLFVSVASVAADPHWIDRGENRHYVDAWTNAAFGELTESARVRRDALVRIVPKLRIASRCTVEDRWLVVRGDLATYRIHLGSANVQMEPGSRYLCIVVDRGASRTAAARVVLPFEEDGTLSVVLSKALLLADDRKIKDESIMLQLRASR